MDKHALQHRLAFLQSSLQSGEMQTVRAMLNKSLSAADVAHIIESSPPRLRAILWQLIDREVESDVLPELGEEVQQELLGKMETEEIVSVLSDLDTDDLADLIQQLPSTITNEVLQSMESVDRERVSHVLSYEEDTAGGLMNTDTVTIRPDITLDVVIRYLRMHKTLPDNTDTLYVVGRKNRYIGVLHLHQILTNDPDTPVREVMSTLITPLKANVEASEVARIFEKDDVTSMPVIDEMGKLLGRITVDDVVDVIREEADHSLMSMAGLDEEADTFAPVLKTTRNRAVWLGINLVTAFLASIVIAQFEATLDKVVALAVIMGIVPSMGGIAGNQTLTLVIRGMALGQVGKFNISWLINREFVVGLLNGLLWAVVVSTLSSLWFDDINIGIVIGAAMVVNLIIATISGAALPIFLKSRGIDPAIAGGVILTTITDVVGYFAFLSIATLIFL